MHAKNRLMRVFASCAFGFAALLFGATQPAPAHFTLTALLKPQTKPTGVLFAARPADGAAKCPLKITAEKEGLKFEVQMSPSRPPLTLCADKRIAYDGEPHRLALRYAGPNLELFVDGVLVDEEWPIGDAAAMQLPEKSALGDIALETRALSDAEIQTRAGSALPLEARAEKLLGKQEAVGAFWKPRGDVYVGDCMPFYHNGRYHLYYLLDRHRHKSKWKFGAHQWAHISTADFKTWEHHPLAIAITDQSEGSICTGSTFFHDGKFYAFYANRKVFDTPEPRLQVRIGDDAVHFPLKRAVLPLAAPYIDQPTRDPFVFQDPQTGKFHMLITTALSDEHAPIAKLGGCLAHLVSDDLEHWEQLPPFIVPGFPGQPECPEWFEWNGRYYLVFSNSALARYRIADSPLGPWKTPAVDALDCASVRVMKSAPWRGNRRIGTGFVSEGNLYAGWLVFREYVQLPDGQLGTKWVEELVPETAAPLALDFAKVCGSARAQGNAVAFDASPELAAMRIANAPDSHILRFKARPQKDAVFFGVRLLASDKVLGGVELRFEPTREKASLRAIDAKHFPNSLAEEPKSTLYNVAGLDRAFDVEVLVKNGKFVDVQIGRERTIAQVFDGARTGGQIYLFARGGGVEFSDIEVAPLRDSQ